MALPMLVGGGAECGPANPLQGLSKRFDHDRGIQQDHFGAGRAGSSKEIFRTQQGNTSSQDQDAARFFSANTSHVPQFIPDPAYDLSGMRAALPMNPAPQIIQQNPLASWASDFMSQPMQHHSSSSKPLQAQLRNVDAPMQVDVRPAHHVQTSPITQSGSMQWNPALSNFRMNSMPTFMPQLPMQHQLNHHHQVPAAVNSQSISWDKEFNEQELQHAISSSTITQEAEQVQETHHTTEGERDELARTAGLLLEHVQHEQNPKFQNSQFMGLMKQLRDGEVTVDGNKVVESDGRTSARVDVKGKGRALGGGGGVPIPMTLQTLNGSSYQANLNMSQNQGTASREEKQGIEEDENDAYFRQENEEFTRYWNDTQPKIESAGNAETASWGKFQDEWDRFEATMAGIKPLTNYQFQANNPYMLGDSSRTRTHLLHTQGRQSVLESVLELEASVQRNMTDAGVWYELGVKQQENEREHKALQALRRAVDLDPTHLPAWLALAISYTNDNDRQGTYNAIEEWVTRNEQYKDAVTQFLAQTSNSGNMSLVDKYTQMIQCLITMARSTSSEEVDADIQIALAILLNTNEEYEKAQDCFRTALAVRPEDWLLYNRVGATMANSGRAEEALDYYYRALELNPGYIRARFNLGISCINLRRYEEAAQHILDALALQESDGVRDMAESHEKRGVVSTALWDSLKTTCLHMQRADLVTFCELKDLDGFRTRFHQG